MQAIVKLLILIASSLWSNPSRRISPFLIRSQSLTINSSPSPIHIASIHFSFITRSGFIVTCAPPTIFKISFLFAIVSIKLFPKRYKSPTASRILCFTNLIDTQLEIIQKACKDLGIFYHNSCLDFLESRKYPLNDIPFNNYVQLHSKNTLLLI